MATPDEIIANLKAKLDSDAASVAASVTQQISDAEASTIAQVSDALATLVPPGGTMTDAQKAVIMDVISKLQALIA